MEHVIEKEKMDSIKALADTNIEISKAKQILFNLQETETEYLVQREKKALSKIQKAVEESRELIDEIHQNYEKVKDFHKETQNLTVFLEEAYNKFNGMVEDFDKRTKVWEVQVGDQQKEISSLKQEIRNDREEIENDRKSLKSKEKMLEGVKAHLESRQATLEASYRVEKDLWDKLNKK